jgi:cellulose synthase/poly-beta-1,6-N-acetylglucosamine synthase-like glycosyltransferase
MMAEIVFWSAVGLAAYNLVLFPAFVIVSSYLFGRPVRKDAAHTPFATVLITAHNEEKHIGEKLANTAAFDYPSSSWEILVALDGCTDRTRARIDAAADPRVRVLDYPERRGKTPVQNDASREARGEVIFYTDATVMHPPDALRRLAATCADPRVGCVTGSVSFQETSGATREGVATRLEYEQFVRGRLGILYSMLGATGAIYMMPKRAVREVPLGLTHDFCAPLLALMEGLRTVYEPAALATVRRPVGDSDELRRRTRITVQGLTAVFGLRGALDVVRHPALALTMISMRLLKWLNPIFFLAAFCANIALAERPFYRVTLGLQLAFYGLAALGGLLQRHGKPPRVVSVPFYFCLLNVSALRGIWKFARGERLVVWEPTSR